MNDLIERLQSNLPKVYNPAYTWIYQNCYPMCVQLVLKHQQNTLLAEHIFQDALIILVKKVRQPNFVLTSKVSTYLYGVCKNLLRRHLESENKKSTALEQIEIQEIPLVEDNSITKHRIEFILQTLNSFEKEDCKQLLQKFYLGQMPLKELATLLGYSQAYVKIKRFKCLKYLKKRVLETIPSFQ